MREKEIQLSINKLVIEGKLPIAFYNTDIIYIEKNIKTEQQRLVNSIYKQINIPRKESDKLISKIYEIY
ncbi:hypothetical protein BAX94_01875 [Elizabethkingia meningoseptica]|uniref:Uncharacterized protein n=1 Tax=Elizabethkingia meningoseptica TaxID=238 RepID=A0A1V3TWW9_ELIME|nr:MULTISPECIES: hypothetical protein [Elizabethkingia]AQX12495.1 hypothetical protein BBD35_08985 [Elizabethkingia meningoseptica]MBG0514038.1 hypothetical protein [Elizabethkingia meningoseptica]MDE5432953.1 hypothetical protein [Elizabethkingia meningoseptica]MDE5471616.1 hypothetical protein [Elizabethkingia meningoseptica]MDE5481603.1 hypothetical protein [Elizabethkingia meningoseptica]